MRRFSAIVTAFVFTGLIASGSVGAVDMNGVVKARQGKFKELGGHMKAIGDALAAGHADAGTIQPHALAIAALAHDLPSWFPAGSGPESGADTEALPIIWQKPTEFQAAAQKLADESQLLLSVSAGGDPNAIGAELKAVGGTCGGCHHQFRKPQ